MRKARRRETPAARARVIGALVAGGIAVGLAGGPPAVAADAPQPELPVTVIADSVLTAVEANPAHLAALGRGFRLTLDVGICRRVSGTSCPHGESRVPTVVDVVRQLGPAIGPTVVVEVGYNDPADTFAASVEEAIRAMLDAGARHILWLTLSERRQQYIAMNDVLRTAAAHHPEVVIVDWNAASIDHPSWFQADDVHLEYEGAAGLAAALHAALDELVPPLVVETSRLARGRVGLPYAARLVATGGAPPSAWRVGSGTLPRGLHLLADGRVIGLPRRASSGLVLFLVTDARGVTVALRMRLTVLRT